MLINNANITGSLAVVGTTVLSGSLTLSGSMNTIGTITATTLVVQTITSSISSITGSTSFGSSSINNHNFTGSLIVSGAMFISSSGQVGIGSTSASSTLEIYGVSDNNFTDGLRVSRNTLQNTQYGIFNYAGGILNITAVDTQFSAPAIRFNTSTTGSGTPTERMRVAATGAVTVTNTTAALDIFTISSPPNLGNVQLALKSNSGGNTSYGGLNVQSSNGKAGYLTCGDSSTTTWYGAQADYVTLSATLGAAMKFRVNASDSGGITIATSGNVLINTTTDNGDKLQIKGTIGIGFNTTTDSGAAITGYFSNGTSNSFLSLGTSYGVASGGDVALQLFTTGKTIYVRNVSAGVYMSQGSTSWTANSDETIKDIIEPITNASDKLKDLRTVIYKLKNDESETRKIGLIAQDVEKVLPEAIVKSYQKEYDREILGLNYTDLVPVLVKAIQELKAEIDELKNNK